MLINKIKNKLDKPIALVGLMGSGKSSVGRMLAEELGLNFMDSDVVVVEQAGMSIPEIFEQKGEPYFRTLEREVIEQLAQDKAAGVIGTGGGAFMNEQTRNLILNDTISVFLHADLENLTKRVGTGEGRPLFKDKAPRDVLADLITQRYPIYREARIVVNTQDESVQETMNRVLQALYNALPNR